MKVRTSVVIAFAAAGGLVLAGCSGGSGAGTAGGGSSSGAEEVKTIKLVAAEYSKDNTKAFWDAFAKTYNEKTGYTLEVNVVSWDNIDQQSSTMIQNNQAPDILNLNAYASYAKDGLLYNGDEVLPDAVKSDILEAFQKSGTYEGKFYGFPDLSSARAFFYNTDLFTKAGIANAPKTWDELKDAATKITALGDGNVGYALPLGPEESQGEFSMWLFNNGGDWKKDGKWAINSAQNVETLTFLKERKEVYQAGLPNVAEEKREALSAYYADVTAYVQESRQQMNLSQNPQTLDFPQLDQYLNANLKERDLDLDGSPERVDIDDQDSRVQLTHHLDKRDGVSEKQSVRERLRSGKAEHSRMQIENENHREVEIR